MRGLVGLSECMSFWSNIFAASHQARWDRIQSAPWRVHHFPTAEKSNIALLKQPFISSESSLDVETPSPSMNNVPRWLPTLQYFHQLVHVEHYCIASNPMARNTVEEGFDNCNSSKVPDASHWHGRRIIVTPASFLMQAIVKPRAKWKQKQMEATCSSRGAWVPGAT